MGKSTFISAALHTAILLWALVAFPAAKMDRAPLLAIPVDLATPAEVTKIKAGMADAKDEAPLAGKPKEEKPEAVKEAKKPVEQTAEAAEKPKAEQKPEEKLKTETPKEAAPKPEAKKPEEKPAKPKEAAAAPAAKTGASGGGEKARLQHRQDRRAPQQDSRRGERAEPRRAVR